MKNFFFFVIFSSGVILLIADSASTRIFKERVRSQDDSSNAEPAKPMEEEVVRAEDTSGAIGSLDTFASLVRVQRDQAETFRLWSSQFQVFKNNVMRFMDQTSDVLQKNEKKIKTLQRVVRKISHDIDE